MSKSVPPLERAARALCSLAGNSEDAMNDGKPLWQDYLPEARAVIAEARMDWRPIKSAPQDGTPLLLFVPTEASVNRRVIVGFWDKANSRWTAVPTVYRMNPAYWLPLPPHPQS